MNLSRLACACVLLALTCFISLSADVAYRTEEFLVPDGFKWPAAYHIDNSGNVVGHMVTTNNPGAPGDRCITKKDAFTMISYGDKFCAYFVWTKENGFTFLTDLVEPWLYIQSVDSVSDNGHMMVTGIDKRDLWADTDSIRIKTFRLIPITSSR